ncbi:MAG: response regulator [Pseudomonadota bacterium]
MKKKFQKQIHQFFHDRHSGHSPIDIPFLPHKTIAGLMVAIFTVVLISFLSYQALKNRTESSLRFTHTLQVIAKLQAIRSTLKDAETGQRGFLLVGSLPYLEPYNSAKLNFVNQIKELRQLTFENQLQKRRVENLEKFVNEKMAELEKTIALKKQGNSEAALSIVRTDTGQELMEKIRTLLTDLENEEQNLFDNYQNEWRKAEKSSISLVLGGAGLLLVLIGASALMASADYRIQEIFTWLQKGEMGLSLQLQGDQPLSTLGDNILEFLADYLKSPVANIYIAEEHHTFRRFAGYALLPGAQDEVVHAGEGLLGQAIKDQHLIHITDIPEGYLPVSSTIGRGAPREIIIFPAMVDGFVYAVLEFGFFRHVQPTDQELLKNVGESIAIAIRTSKDRTRLQGLLEETQQQAEELQMQQEELRVNNEELEEQGRALKETQVQMESQHAELEQTNTQLESQAQMLENQRDSLAKAQLILKEKATELERSNQYKSEFLANMSHELRTPLNSTLILAKLLADNKEGNLTSEQIKFAQTISAAGNDLLTLINDILDLSKIEAGKIELVSESVHVGRMVDTVVNPFRATAQEKKVEIEAHLEAGVPDFIETDSQRVGQIIKNLLSNALKFTSKGKVVLRVFSSTDDEISFAVSDTGIGISPDQQAIIFDAFRQADGSTHRKFGGTGLGLSISRDLAHLLGGAIKVKSTPGVGSIFTLTLPVIYKNTEITNHFESKPKVAPEHYLSEHLQDKQQNEHVTNALASPSPIMTNKIDDDRDRLKPGTRLIVVIEDDIHFSAILRDLSHEMGFQCVITHTAQAGLEAAARYNPSAIVLDMHLPDLSGLSVLDQLKRNSSTRHIPVHVVSGTDYTQEALTRGAIGYALKPVKREELIEAFNLLEAKLSQGLRKVLVVEDDERQRESVRQLLSNQEVEITVAESAAVALEQLKAGSFDCMVMDLNLPDVSGYELLKQMSEQDDVSFPPVIVYTGHSLTRDEEQKLRYFSKSIIVKGARSPERLLDEVTLFLHQVESELPMESQRLLKAVRDRETTFEGRRILVVEDDVRNIFALSAFLEPKGVKLEIARNGREALEALERSTHDETKTIDLVLMDIMMPEMDGLTATREIRKNPEWKKLPIIALTAKAMKDDQEKCLAAGANDYIAKPLDVDKLMSLVRVWMPK